MAGGASRGVGVPRPGISHSARAMTTWCPACHPRYLQADLGQHRRTKPTYLGRQGFSYRAPRLLIGDAQASNRTHPPFGLCYPPLAGGLPPSLCPSTYFTGFSSCCAIAEGIRSVSVLYRSFCAITDWICPVTLLAPPPPRARLLLLFKAPVGPCWPPVGPCLSQYWRLVPAGG